MKRIFVTLLTLVFIIMLSTPALAATDDIVDIASGDENFSILVTALQEADLVGALQGEGPFTVFAPTNDAFAALLGALDITAADLLAQPDLADVLLYHVVSGKVMSTDLTDDMMATTLQGESLTVDLDDGVMINSSMVTTADIEATNGVIHVIDAVLVPESFELTGDIVDIAVGDENFSILVAALQEADLVGALQGEGPFTVFAPTNDAFADLLAALDISAADLLAQPDLAEVLLYHVVSGKVMSTDLMNGMMAETLQGESLTVDLDDGVMIDSSMVTIADIETTNGVIHVIDTVLVPESFVLEETMETMETTEETDMPYTGGDSYSTQLILVGALLAITLFIRKRVIA